MAAMQLDPTINLQALPWVSVLISGGIAMWGGLVVTLNRLDETGADWSHFWKWLTKDLVSAMVAGWLMFFIGGWLVWNVWLIAFSLLAAGYGGTRMLDAVTKKFISKIEES